MTTNATTDAPAISDRHATGPLKYTGLVEPIGLDAKVAQNLRGHSTNRDWIPAGLSPEINELRETHRRLRSQCAADLTELDELLRKFRQEDSEHEEQQRRAALGGWPEVRQDARTLDAERLAERDAILARLKANLEVLADVCWQVVSTLREQESQLLGGLRSGLSDNQAKVREAQLALERAKRASGTPISSDSGFSTRSTTAERSTVRRLPTRTSRCRPPSARSCSRQAWSDPGGARPTLWDGAPGNPSTTATASSRRSREVAARRLRRGSAGRCGPASVRATARCPQRCPCERPCGRDLPGDGHVGDGPVRGRTGRRDRGSSLPDRADVTLAR
jgi:hypothetical protein